MQVLEFLNVFLEIYTVGCAFILIFLIGQIVILMYRIDREMLKAKLFLNEAVLERTWMYISIAGAAFALNVVIKFVVNLTVWGAGLGKYYLYEITQIIFLASFIVAVHSWYVFINSFSRPKKQ